MVVVPGFFLFRVHPPPFGHRPFVFGAYDHFADVFRNDFFDKVFVGPHIEVVGERLFRLFQEVGTVGKIVLQVRGGINRVGKLFGSSQVLDGRTPVAVRCLVADDEHERLVLVSLIQPVDALLGYEFGGIAWDAGDDPFRE